LRRQAGGAAAWFRPAGRPPEHRQPRRGHNRCSPRNRKPRRGNTGVFRKGDRRVGDSIAPDIKQHRSMIVQVDDRRAGRTDCLRHGNRLDQTRIVVPDIADPRAHLKQSCRRQGRGPVRPSAPAHRPVPRRAIAASSAATAPRGHRRFFPKEHAKRHRGMQGEAPDLHGKSAAKNIGKGYLMPNVNTGNGEKYDLNYA
jgi:hypothetical protein